MSNLIVNTKEDQEIVLTQFETAQGWKVKIDLKTLLIWLSTRDICTLLGWAAGGTANQRIGAPEVLAHLRALDLSDQRKTLKIGEGTRADCFDIEQSIAILDFFDAPILKKSQRFGLEVAIKQACGLLETPKPVQLTSTEAIKMMLPAFELAESSPGIGELANDTNLIPCQIITDKPFAIRHWVQVHFPYFTLSRRASTRLGREISAVYSQHHLKRPSNSYSGTTNKYTRKDHPLICQIFNTMLDSGLLELNELVIKP